MRERLDVLSTFFAAIFHHLISPRFAFDLIVRFLMRLEKAQELQYLRILFPRVIGEVPRDPRVDRVSSRETSDHDDSAIAISIDQNLCYLRI